MSLLRVTKALEASISYKSAPAGLPVLTAPEWLRLASYLGQFSESTQPARPGKIANMHQLDIATSLMLGVGRLLDSWPEGFHAILAATQRKEEATPSIRRAFGSIYRVLYTDLRGDRFQFLRDEFERYLHENWWGVVCKRNRLLKPETVAAHPRVTLKQAAQHAGVAPATVRHLVQVELISSGQVILPSGRKVRSIHQNDIAQIEALTNDGVTIADAARLLALSERRVRELMSNGVIKPLISRIHDKAAAWLIPKQQLQGLFFVGNESSNESSLISVGQVLKFWRLRDGEFIALVNAISSSHLMPLADQPGAVALGSVLLDVQETRNWFSARRFFAGSSMSVDEVAQRLGLKQQVAYDLVRCGLLETAEDNLRGRRVTRASFESFQATYISLADFSRALKRTPRWVLRNLRASPISGPSVDGSRQYFFRRSDVCDEFLAVDGVKTDTMNKL